MLKRLLFIVGLILSPFPALFAQFVTTGDATESSCNCFDLTDNVVHQNGSFNQTISHDLTTPFNLKFTVNFGCDGTGGEGIAFVMKNGAWTLGGGGYGLGYESIAGNVLALEFDTRDNQASGEIDNWDVPGDHISLQDNGDIFHGVANPNNLLGSPSGLNAGEVATPHNIKPGFPNLEDCEDHIVEIEWTPGSNQTIKVKVDNITTLTYIGDMITEQFGGNPTIFWGWTGSTSAFKNTQKVCMALVPEFSYTATTCPGVNVDFADASNAFYPITNWSWDFAGLGTSTSPNPSFTFDDPGEYTVALTITDNQGCSKTVTKVLSVGFNTTVTADDSTICPGSTANLTAEGSPFIATECCFKLVLNDLWGDDWGSGTSNEIEIIADGVSFGSYSPISFDPGSGTSDTIDLCFEQGTALEFVIHGEDSPAECSYYFLADDLSEILAVNGATPGTWIEGATETHTVDCGLVVPTYNYLWDNAGLLSDATIANPVATVSTSTWFHVEITDPGTGCSLTDSIEIITHPPVTATISGTATICEGDSAALTIEFTGPSPYDISITGPSGALAPFTGVTTSTYTFMAGENGDYLITSITGDGCEGTFSGVGEITTITPHNVDIESSATYCDGESLANINAIDTDGGTVNWYDNPALTPPAIFTGTSFTPPSIVGSTTYYAAETEGILGCTGDADNVTITINPIPPAPSFAGTVDFCEGDTPTELFGEPSLGGTITWYDALPPSGTVLATSTSFTPTLVAPGFTLYITETAEGCEGNATPITVTVNPTPSAPVVTGVTDYCDGQTASPLNATISGGGTIEWRSTAGTVLQTGITYLPLIEIGSTTINVYEVIGSCESEPTTLTINVQAGPFITLPADETICKGDSIQITSVNSGDDITWSDGQTGNTAWLKPSVTTIYTATASNPGCGSTSDQIVITVNELPIVTANPDTLIGFGGEVALTATSSSESTFSWMPEVSGCKDVSCSEAYAVPNQPTLYIVTATDKNGCRASDTTFVDINGIMEIYVPNIFSPNGDGSNDVLVISGPRLFDYSLEIYDRWGKRVFMSSEQNEYWDGTVDGIPLSPQTFVYILKGKTILNDTIIKEGNITIIK